jgi:hypothetical protein
MEGVLAKAELREQFYRTWRNWTNWAVSFPDKRRAHPPTRIQRSCPYHGQPFRNPIKKGLPTIRQPERTRCRHKTVRQFGNILGKN